MTLKTIPTSQLKVGTFYKFRKRLPKVGSGAQSVPAMTVIETGQLIDKRNNGILIFQVDVKRWHQPEGCTANDLFRLTPAQFEKEFGEPKRAVTKTVLVLVKGGVIAKADEQPATRVPPPRLHAVG